MSEELETTYAFCKAEISTHPDLGFLTLRLIRYAEDPSNGLEQGVLHRLKPTAVQDLIATLQAALLQFRKPTAPDSSGSTRH